MLYFIFLLHYLFQKLKQLFNPKNYYKKKSKTAKEKRETFIPYTTHNQKPFWVQDELIYLKIHLSKYGCRKIAQSFNRKFADTNITVSKSYVYNVIKTNSYEIIKQRKKLKNKIPRKIDNNRIWSIDLTTIKERQVLGVIDGGSRALLTLKHLKDKRTINIIRALLNTIELYGKPKVIHSDNEIVFTSKLMSMVLYILGIRHQITQIASPWQNGKIERLFLTMKESFQDIIFPTTKSLETGLKEFHFFYNHIRPHQHLNYLTPNEAWSNKPMANSKTHEAIYFNALCGNVAGFYFME